MAEPTMPRAQAVFAASRRVARTTNGRHVDVVVADTAADAPGGMAPSVVLAQAPARLSVPAFDPRVHNPTGWQRRGWPHPAAPGAGAAHARGPVPGPAGSGRRFASPGLRRHRFSS